jgi:hypothetical protein
LLEIILTLLALLLIPALLLILILILALCPPAAFLREELAIRLSHRVRDLQELPDGLSEMENVKLVRGWYAESFDELVK